MQNLSYFFKGKAKQAVLMLSFLLFGSQALAALPVIDPAAIAQAVVQVQNQIQQIEHMRSQLQAITDNGNFADLLNNPNIRRALNKYLPQGYRDISQMMNNTEALQLLYQQVLQDEKRNRQNLKSEDRLKIANAMGQAQMIGMLKTLDTRSQSVQNLVRQINRTQNTAQKQDLMNTLQAEQAMIMVDLNKMQVMMQLAQEQQRAAERQAIDEYNKKMITVK